MIFGFDGWELDTELYELRHRGEPRSIEPKAFDLLHLLLRESGRVVGKEEIVREVWSGRSVTDAAVSTAVRSARRALGDDGQKQRYIQTVHSRGYRFLGNSHDSERGAGGEATEGNGADTGGETTPAVGGAPRPSVAVLPFESLGGEVEAYFSDGLTGDIIANLSRFRELDVLAKATTFQFRETDRPLRSFCSELGAIYAVEGSVLRSGDRLRVTAQLVDTRTGVNLWADTYDREMEDLFAVQDELTRTLAAHLGVQVQDLDLQRSLKKSRAELDAHDRVLRARRFTTLLSEESHAEARDLLEQAVELDPDNADAQALLCNVYLAEHRFEVNPRPNPVERAMARAVAATTLDPQNAYARCWLSIVHFFRGENDKFEEEASRALHLNSNDPEILADIGHFLAFMGQFERGVRLSRRAMELNPLHPGWYLFSFARWHYDQRQYRRTLADVERIGLPHFYWTHLMRAAALGQLGRPSAADALEEVYRLKPRFAAREELRKWNAAPDDLEHLLEGLVAAGMGPGT